MNKIVYNKLMRIFLNRAPIVAECDRKRVLLSWAPFCGNVAPQEFQVNFSSVRHLTPRQFVEKLSRELGVHGVVAGTEIIFIYQIFCIFLHLHLSKYVNGVECLYLIVMVGENYRFGYKASGDASALVTLCKEYNMGAYIISSVMDKHQNSINKGCTDLKDRGQVSSTRVRRALAKGDMKYVSELLGRQHRLLLKVKAQEGFTFSEHRMSMPKSCLLNLPPREGVYEQCFLLIHDENPVPCRVTIGSTHIYLELDEVATRINVTSQDFHFLGIEFGESGV